MSEAQLYYDALRMIEKEFMTVEQLRRQSEKTWGLPFQEALEMAYENMQEIAHRTVKGKRRPL